MGTIFSFFRKKEEVSFEKVLQEIDTKIKEIEEKQQGYRTRWRARISSLLFWGVILELFYGLYFYFGTNSNSTMETILWISPLLFIPICGWIMKIVINLYYNRKISNEAIELEDLKGKQKSKLDELARATDFYKTQALLTRYSKTLTSPTADTKNNNAQQPHNSGLKLRRPPQTTQPMQPSPKPQSLYNSPVPPKSVNVAQTLVNNAPVPDANVNPPKALGPIYMPVPRDRIEISAPSPSPTFVPDPNRAWYDKLIDYVIGEGPEQSTALICQQCKSHNGFVPKDELDFMEFKCRTCEHLNKKKRENPLSLQQNTNSNSTDDKGKEPMESPELFSNQNTENKDQIPSKED